MKLFFERRQELATGIWQYFFRSERPVDFVPGQYADFHLTGAFDDPRGQMRTFSITSLPSDALLSIVLKHFELQSPFKQALQTLEPGDELRIDDAMGDMILPKSAAVPLVFVAGGIGISSYASILADLLMRKEERQIYLFYAVRSRREQILPDLIAAYPLQLSQTVIAPNRLNASEILDSVPPESQIYLSGSQAFVEGLRAEFAACGTAHEQIVFDYYDGYSEL